MKNNNNNNKNQKSFISDVVVTVREGVEYLGDQTSRYGRDKMPPLLCRILKLRKISAKHVLNSKGQKVVSVNTFLLTASKSYPFANFSILNFDGCTGIKSFPLPQMTNDQVYKYNTFNAQISFTLGANCRYIVHLQNIMR